ncbi:putative Fe-S cluster protein YjdI [Arcanobacterium wilhelmae]|uniref:Fe-S cluster protein YjdI n=1 Tax=Arcanobacterium wilhelmae TaxID=1803177 RepID=A0ABT9NB48_9ACTO|nr:(4Fe-4S)-binding protein [Arcanobacterium wilhelmae]MDP9800748.1 putative Fe-S cluster protein YjdI [Arcanobacterium wilhelmae]WFN90146.1 (4Fe-4S)-binding protein [Arcanobacterium wilhelmae]
MSVSDIPEGYKAYDAEGISVLWNPPICQHSGNCVRGNGDVFSKNRRPWIDPAAADAEEIAAIIDTCPSGALKYILHKES